MATKRQIAANRRNARKSTGPKTPEGKAQSSRNAIRHGILARNLILVNESRQEFDSLYAEYFHHYQPATPAERYLVEQLVSSDWRQRIALRFEQGVIGSHVGRIAEANRDLDGQTPAGPAMTMLLGEAFLRDTHAGSAIGILTRYEGGLRRAWKTAFDSLNRLRQNTLRENCETNPMKPENPGLDSLDHPPPPAPPFPEPLDDPDHPTQPREVIVRWVDPESFNKPAPPDPVDSQPKSQCTPISKNVREHHGGNQRSRPLSKQRPAPRQQPVVLNIGDNGNASQMAMIAIQQLVASMIRRSKKWGGSASTALAQNAGLQWRRRDVETGFRAFLVDAARKIRI